MVGKRRRKQTLRAWRQSRASQGAPALEAQAPAARVRPRRRAPAPRLMPSSGTVRNWLGGPRRWLAIGAIASASALVAYFAMSSSYRVAGAHVQGNTRVPAEAIYAAADLDGRHMLAVQRHAVTARIEALPGIDRAVVRVSLPSLVTIAVTETEPVIGWDGPAGPLAVDADGHVFAPVAPTGGLVRVRDRAGLVQGPGDSVDPELVVAVRSYGPHFPNLSYESGIGLVAETREGWLVRLGTDSSLLERQLANLAAVRSTVTDAGGAVALVDLRFPTRPYYRIHGGAD